MSTVIVKTDDLRETLRLIGNDHMKYTELSIIENDDVEDDSVSKFLSINATNDFAEFVEYEEIDNVSAIP